MTRLCRWIKRLLGLYRHKRRHAKPSLLANYINYFTATPQKYVRRDRGEAK